MFNVTYLVGFQFKYIQRRSHASRICSTSGEWQIVRRQFKKKICTYSQIYLENCGLKSLAHYMTFHIFKNEEIGKA